MRMRPLRCSFGSFYNDDGGQRSGELTITGWEDEAPGIYFMESDGEWWLAG